MSKYITANDLKTKGVSLIEEEAAEYGEAIITVRGKVKFVVLPIEKYNEFREYELLVALDESRKDIEEGRFKVESVEDHIKRITRG
ncbi:MAG: type II toxin-antitoxin system prevent-host-death family antitoxin [Candidatus Delongbacteria bacterium]|nr:type II toxin-antitoxin system prevent-host-death family antitoxin [Candidatus Delongbacteria bacterium]